MRFTELQGRTEEPPIPPRRSTRSSAPPPYTPRYSTYGFIILLEEEEKKLSHLEKRLVANVDFDDQALNYLGFGTNIYYMLGQLGSLLEINPLPTPLYGCNMVVLVASKISCIEVRWSTNGCNWNGAIA
jgi:hypothetical protein